ncbi:MAG: aldo/keto reductase [Gammaproteobacteria bacterium]
MLRRKLGLDGPAVSVLTLGTMNFTLADRGTAWAQLDRAVAAGINLVDTAEMYPAPASAEHYGESEQVLGEWLRSRGRPRELMVASKAAGPAAFVPWIRGGRSRHDDNNLSAAVEGSLTRLGVDTIDLYQLHWPDRATNFFGQLGFRAPQDEAAFDPEATLRALEGLVAAGKVRYVGLCNETAWGVGRFLELARAGGLPRVVSVQNPYNLLSRGLEVGLAEVVWREQCGLLTYSPLAFGMLSGKYHDGSAGADARLERHRHYRRYTTNRAREAAARYLDIARAAGLDPVLMAIAWCASKPYVSSVIIGATSLAQLEHNLAAPDVDLPKSVLKAIDAVHEEISNPCP